MLLPGAVSLALTFEVGTLQMDREPKLRCFFTDGLQSTSRQASSSRLQSYPGVPSIKTSPHGFSFKRLSAPERRKHRLPGCIFSAALPSLADSPVTFSNPEQNKNYYSFPTFWGAYSLSRGAFGYCAGIVIGCFFSSTYTLTTERTNERLVLRDGDDRGRH